MVLKRKRSCSELSSSTSCFSSPTRPNSMDSDGGAPLSPLSAFSTGSGLHVTPSHLPSRTMKRFRDGRPSDEEVHRKFYEWRAHHRKRSSSSCPNGGLPSSVSAERTLNLLYGANHHHQQQHQPQHYSADTNAPSPSCLSTITTQANPSAQRSLHSFWNIGTAPSPASSMPLADQGPAAPRSTHCDDCGAGLTSAEGGDSMDVDGCGLESDPSCGACSKAVCSHCSVTNLGDQRRCLQCAGRKVWVGGLGWTSVSVPVC